MDRFGRDSASALTRASVTLASMQALRMAGVSRSVLGGNSGRAFQETRGSYGRAGGVSIPAKAYTPEIIHVGSGSGAHAYFTFLHCPAVALPIEIYTDERVREFNESEAELAAEFDSESKQPG